MTMIKIELPDDLAQRANQAGLLSEQAIRQLLEEAMRRHAVTDNPLFGIWQDREDVADVAAHVRRLRETRYDSDGSRREK